eukprot:TRINITY_DN1093_c1_g1_i1.p1 TRINITY_DN1093_c1_g1~~TRINITY_DN1093_c1_g1_i1.p1  ORF type:complete len:741 (+),score=279.48 TRINITY_DN1093_c1_g1_i1:39-2261(+)
MLQPCAALLRRSARYEEMARKWAADATARNSGHLMVREEESDLQHLEERAEAPATTRSTVFDRMRGYDDHGTLLNKVDTHSIERMKYGTQSELDSVSEDGLVPQRDVPPPVTKCDARYGRARIDALQLEKMPTTKTPLSITYVNPYHIPDVLRGTDQCPGCGALMQSREQFAPGYTSLLDIKLHIENHDRVMKLRERYYSRQARLQEAMKEAGGFQPGMEYQDYITEEELEAVHRYQPEPIICQKCRHIQSHTYDSKKAIMPMDEWRTELAEIAEPAFEGLIVVVVSMWDVEGTWPKGLNSITGGKKVLMIGTHGDCLPRPWEKPRRQKDKQGNRIHHAPVSEAQQEQWDRKLYHLCGKWLHARAKERGVRLHDAIVVGNQRKRGIDVAAAAIQHLRKGKDVFLIGCVNVGKSSFVSNLYERFRPNPAPHPAAELVTDIVGKGKNVEYVQRWHIPEEAAPPEKAMSMTLHNPFEKSIATVTDVPGSTMKKMAFKIQGEGDKKPARIVDTPGIVQRGHLVNILPLGVVSQLTPKARVSVNYFKVLPGFSVFLGCLARVDVVKGPAHGVLIKAVGRWNRLSAQVLATHESDIFYEKWKGVTGVMSPPRSPQMLDEIGPLVEEEIFFIEGSKKSAKNEICINGVAFFVVGQDRHQQAQDVVLRVSMVRGLTVTQRPALLNLSNMLPRKASIPRRRKSWGKVHPYLLQLAAEKRGLPYPVPPQKMVRPIEDDDDDDNDDNDDEE